MSGPRRGWRLAAAIGLLPLALVLNEIAARNEDAVELLYGRKLYPRIAAVLGAVNGLFPFSLAELLIGVALLLGSWRFAAAVQRTRRAKTGWGRFFLGGILWLWAAAGAMLLSFLILWGFNYARPGLAARMELSTGTIRPEELLDAGRRMAGRAATHHASLGVSRNGPTRLPLSFSQLDRALAEELRREELAGYLPAHPTSPAKRLFLSPLLCYLGLSGIFIPFTGEPSINDRIPDCSLPLALAHERAHQLGVTDEGEASLAAFLACEGAERHPYLRYSASLDAAARLLSAASRFRREEARVALEAMGPGPLADLAALRDFWARYHGPLARGAERVNDAYLKSLRVRGGVESYERIVELLVALDRQGRL